LEDEGFPTRRSAKVGIQGHGELSGAQGLGGREFVSEHTAIETGHQLSGGPFIDVPQADHNSLCAGMEESPRHPDRPFTSDIGTQACLAGAQDYQVSGDVEMIDLGCPDNAILMVSVLVKAGQYETGDVWMLSGKMVGGNMDYLSQCHLGR
jgi:hypothetical protein